MNVTIAYCMAGLSTLSLIVLWFVNTHKVLRRKEMRYVKRRKNCASAPKTAITKKG